MAELSVQKEFLAALVKQLPVRLRAGLRVEVLEAALQEGYLRIVDESHWEWLLGTDTLLAYFCGRMWCGDTPIYSKCTRRWIWQSGEMKFPRKELVPLFGARNLRSLRKKRFMRNLPVGWELVESIFEKNE